MLLRAYSITVAGSIISVYNYAEIQLLTCIEILTKVAKNSIQNSLIPSLFLSLLAINQTPPPSGSPVES